MNAADTCKYLESINEDRYQDENITVKWNADGDCNP